MIKLSKELAKHVVPKSKHYFLKRHLNIYDNYSTINVFVRRLGYFGLSRYCPVCKGRFRTFLSVEGDAARPDARCPVCGVRERHRLVWAFFRRHTDLFAPWNKEMLHIAPEPYMRMVFEEDESIEYTSGDLTNEWRSNEKIDVTDIKYPQNTFDAIYCSHVLEHVQDDQRAMRELYCVLNTKGWAVLQVPISGEETREDPSITDPEERRRLFGHRNHVRQYGQDYKDRLRAVGFEVCEYPASEVVDEGELERMGIVEGESVFYCTKE